MAISVYSGLYRETRMATAFEWQALGAYTKSGAHPTNDIAIEFEIIPKVGVLSFKMNSTDHNDTLYTS